MQEEVKPLGQSSPSEYTYRTCTRPNLNHLKVFPTISPRPMSKWAPLMAWGKSPPPSTVLDTRQEQNTSTPHHPTLVLISITFSLTPTPLTSPSPRLRHHAIIPQPLLRILIPPRLRTNPLKNRPRSQHRLLGRHG
jgi:hypothetical protein